MFICLRTVNKFQYIELKPALIRNCILALISMLLVSFVMIPNYGAAFAIAGAICSIDLGKYVKVVGYFHKISPFNSKKIASYCRSHRLYDILGGSTGKCLNDNGDYEYRFRGRSFGAYRLCLCKSTW